MKKLVIYNNMNPLLPTTKIMWNRRYEMRINKKFLIIYNSYNINIMDLFLISIIINLYNFPTY